jgi:ribosome-associated protein
LTEKTFDLEREFIPLMGFLKRAGIAATGGHAGMMVLDGEVKVNGLVATEKRKKLKKGDRVELASAVFIIQ